MDDTIELEEDGEDMDGSMLGGGGDEFSMIYLFPLHGMVIV